MEAIGFILAGVLGVASTFLLTTLGKMAKENQQLRMELMRFQTKEVAYKMNAILANSKLESKPKLQKQTESLLVLAVRSSNENESRAAAVQACKRIHKELGIK